MREKKKEESAYLMTEKKRNFAHSFKLAFCCRVVGYIDAHVNAFLCMWTSTFPRNICWKDYLCHTEIS